MHLTAAGSCLIEGVTRYEPRPPLNKSLAKSPTRRLNDHRLEGGGFDSRLKARLVLVQGSGDFRPRRLSPGARSTTADLIDEPEPDLLEVFAWKARDFRSQNE